MTLRDLAAKGICRFRRPMWASPDAYAYVYMKDGFHGPWLKLYDRKVQVAIGEPTPQTVLCLEDDTADYEPYAGQRDEADCD